MIQPADIQVLFCDAALLVINKPAGLRALPDGYHPALPHIKSVLEQDYSRLWIVHRLDKETSGTLILARTAAAHRALNIQFEQHQIVKIYHALVIGNPEWHEQTISLPLRPNGDRHHRTVIDPQAGKPAITQLKVLKRFGEYCLIEAIPETGRTHQIRAHLAAVELPIAGDKLYGQAKSTIQAARLIQGLAVNLWLHACSLEINHPTTGERMIFQAPYPSGWSNLPQQLQETE